MALVLQSELEKLKARGVSIGDLRADELERLVHACDRMERPFGDINADAAGLPVQVGEGVSLWRLSIGALVWLEEYAGKWWADMPRRYFWALVYASRHGRERDAFVRLRNEEDAERAITEDALTMAAREDEVADALDEVLGLKDKDGKARGAEGVEAPDWASIIARLESQSGIPADTWAWDRSCDYALRCYADLSRFAAASEGRKAPRRKDDLDRATIALARTTAGIVERVAKEAKA